MEILREDEQLPWTLPDSQEHRLVLGQVAWDVLASSSLLYHLESQLKN